MEIIRPPVITILGHVDHGKTSLLDYIRKSNVASREHGGITQHIGAYQIEVDGKLITFIDTPGHAAFEKMRSRGARAADIAVLVVAIDDGVMPQTVEAIKHIQQAKVLSLVAVNKVDLALGKIDKQVALQKIKKQLSDQGVIIEEYGGDVPLVEVSAKTGEGVDKLLEVIQLLAEVQDFRGDPSLPTQGVVIESSLDKFKGPVATILVRNGTLKKGDAILVGGVKGKIRGLFDYLGKSIDQAGLSTPVEVLGLESVPAVGAVLGEESQKKAITEEAASLIDKLRAQDKKTLKLVIKADKQGSLEAIEDNLGKFNDSEKLVEVVSSGTGDIVDGDIHLGAAIGAIVVGFNVKVTSNAQRQAEAEKVLVRTYNVIYELIEEMEEVIEGLIKVGEVAEVLGKAEVLAVFPHGKEEKIAGCRVLEGSIAKGQRIRVVRNEQILGETKIKSMKKVKEEVQKTEKGNDCGMLFDPPLDFQIGDYVESFRVI